MKKFFLCLFVILGQYSFAQDIIITKDGDALKVYGLEVSKNSIFYKNSSEENAPILRMQKSDLLMIKYEDGRKEIIGENSKADEPEKHEETSHGTIAISQDNLSPEVQKVNLQRIKDSNSASPIFIGKDSLKEWKADGMCFVLGIKEGSIIETPELSVSARIVNWVAEHSFSKGILKKEKIIEHGEEAPFVPDSWVRKIIITLKNKTNKTIFVDLGNSFVINLSKTSPYYIPTAQTSVSGTSSGAGVNLGAITGALGVGGVAGTLADGVTVGGGTMNQNSKTTFSQRVISIPPMSSRSMDPMDIGEGYQFNGINNGRDDFHDIVKHIVPTLIEKGYAEMVKGHPTMKPNKRGYKINLDPIPNQVPLSTFFTYSTSEQFTTSYSFKVDFYVRQIILYTDFYKQFESSSCPFYFLQWSTKGLRDKVRVLD